MQAQKDAILNLRVAVLSRIARLKNLPCKEKSVRSLATIMSDSAVLKELERRANLVTRLWARLVREH